MHGIVAADGAALARHAGETLAAATSIRHDRRRELARAVNEVVARHARELAKQDIRNVAAVVIDIAPLRCWRTSATVSGRCKIEQGVGRRHRAATAQHRSILNRS